MERLSEGKVPESEFSIRFHHLGYFLEFQVAFSGRFDGLKPWQLPGSDLPRARRLVKGFVSKDLKTWKKTRHFIENTSNGNKDGDKILKYLYDTIGFSEEEFNSVVRGREDLLNKLLGIAKSDKNAQILLTTEPDNYCRTCIVGKHCVRSKISYLFKIKDGDFVFEESIEHLLQNGRWNGKLTREEGKIFVTPELLFETEFFRTVWKDIERSGNGEWL